MVDKSRSRKQGGAGLGLATTSLIIRVHHGMLRIESTIGEGTTMHVLLPGKEVEKDEAQMES